MQAIEDTMVVGPNLADFVRKVEEPSGWAFEIDGVPVPQDQWEIARPSAGALVVVRALPQKKIIAILLPVAFLLVGVFLGPAIAGALGFSGPGMFGLQAGSLLVRGALGIIGSLIASALVPPPKQPSVKNEAFAALQSITGTSNSVNPFGPIPRLYGTRRYFPPVPTTATPYTELVGDDQYLRMMLCLGYGPKLKIGGKVAGAGAVITQATSGLDPDAIKIGDTRLLDYDDVEFQIGAPDDLDLYTNQIEEATLSITLDASDTDPWDPGDKHGDINLVDTATATQTTAPDTDEIAIDLAALQGLYGVSYKGKTTIAEVTYRIEYRAHGSTGSWTVVDAGWVISSKKRETLRVGRRWTVTKGQYDVRVTRIATYVATQNAGSIQMTWTALRSIHHHRAFIVPNTVCMALRIKATDQLNSVIQTLSVEAQAIIPVWNGSAWVDTATNNAAWAAVDVWTGIANPRPRPKTDIDLDAFAAWAAWLDEIGFEFNQVIDSQSSVFEEAQQIYAAGLASWGMVDGKISVVRDVPDNLPRALITPRNIVANSLNWSINFIDMPHALRVRFIDPELNQQTERLVYADGYSGDGSGGTLVATKFETLDTIGCTDATQAWKIGRYHQAQAILRPETYEVEQDYEHLTYGRGDLAHLTHDVVSVGLGWARVVELYDDGSFLVDDDVTMEAGKSYAIRARSQVDSAIQVTFAAITTVPGTDRLIAPAAPVAGLQVGDLICWGEAESVTIAVKPTRVIPDVDLTARITLVPAALDIYACWAGEIPAFDPETSRVDTGDLSPGVPTIISIRSDATVQPVETVNNSRQRMVVAYRLQAGVPADQVEVRYRQTDGSHTWSNVTAPSGAAFVFVEGVEQGVEYDVQIRARRNTNSGPRYSAWGPNPVETHTVEEVTSQIDTDHLQPGAASASVSQAWSGSTAIGGTWLDLVDAGPIDIYALTDDVDAFYGVDFDASADAGDTVDLRVRIVDQDGVVVMAERSLTSQTTAANASNSTAFSPRGQGDVIPANLEQQIFTLQARNFGDASITATAASLKIVDRRA